MLTLLITIETTSQNPALFTSLPSDPCEWDMARTAEAKVCLLSGRLLKPGPGTGPWGRGGDSKKPALGLTFSGEFMVASASIK